MQGSVTLTPLELLALAALPLSSISSALKEQITSRFGSRDEQSDDQTNPSQKG